MIPNATVITISCNLDRSRVFLMRFLIEFLIIGQGVQKGVLMVCDGHTVHLVGEKAAVFREDNMHNFSKQTRIKAFEICLYAA